MDPLDFLKVARNLHESEDESERRTSIGRSYFALFNYVRQTVESVRNVPKDEDAHRVVPDYLDKTRNKDLKSIGQTLRFLRKSRNTADYELMAAIEPAVSRVALARATRAVESFKRLRSRAVGMLRYVPNFRAKT